MIFCLFNHDCLDTTEEYLHISMSNAMCKKPTAVVALVKTLITIKITFCKIKRIEEINKSRKKKLFACLHYSTSQTSVLHLSFTHAFV